MTHDPSNGYDRLAAEFMAARSSSGVAVVEKWAAYLPDNASVLDVGAGHGYPLTPVLLKAGCRLSAIEASPTLAEAHFRNFPDVRIALETAEASDFFGETFEAVMAVGLMFLLPEKTQSQLIPRIAAALKPKGRLLFSAPKQRCEWVDVLTGQMSYSLGAEAYEAILNHCGLTVVGSYTDSGESHYYNAEKL